MDYNLAGIRRRVQIDKLDDEEYDSSVIDNFINDTLRDVFNECELPFMEKIFTGDIPVGATIFSFPTDVAQPQSMVIISPEGNATDIMNYQMDFRDFNIAYPVPLNNTASQITRWALYGGKMLLSAPTDKAYTLSTFYIKKPVLLTQDSDIPEVPEEFMELLVLGAYKKVLERDGDFDLAQNIGMQYNKMLGMLVSRYGFRTNGPIIMRRK